MSLFPSQLPKQRHLRRRLEGYKETACARAEGREPAIYTSCAYFGDSLLATLRLYLGSISSPSAFEGFRLGRLLESGASPVHVSSPACACQVWGYFPKAFESATDSDNTQLCALCANRRLRNNFSSRKLTLAQMLPQGGMQRQMVPQGQAMMQQTIQLQPSDMNGPRENHRSMSPTPFLLWRLLGCAP